MPYGVLPVHYDVVGQALLATLEAGLGAEWNDQARPVVALPITPCPLAFYARAARCLPSLSLLSSTSATAGRPPFTRLRRCRR